MANANIKYKLHENLFWVINVVHVKIDDKEMRIFNILITVVVKDVNFAIKV